MTLPNYRASEAYRDDEIAAVERAYGRVRARAMLATTDITQLHLSTGRDGSPAGTEGDR
jgi:hypothetical protein